MLSVGVRPCSGAILVLVLAFSLNLVWAGAAAVLAMSVGTRSPSRSSRRSPLTRAGRAIALGGHLAVGGRWLAPILDAVAMLGGILIILLGLALLHGSLSIARHPLL